MDYEWVKNCAKIFLLAVFANKMPRKLSLRYKNHRIKSSTFSTLIGDVYCT